MSHLGRVLLRRDAIDARVVLIRRRRAGFLRLDDDLELESVGRGKDAQLPAHRFRVEGVAEDLLEEGGHDVFLLGGQVVLQRQDQRVRRWFEGVRHNGLRQHVPHRDLIGHGVAVGNHRLPVGSVPQIHLRENSISHAAGNHQRSADNQHPGPISSDITQPRPSSTPPGLTW